MGTLQALILSLFSRKVLTQTPLFSAWDMKQTKALSLGKVEGKPFLSVWSWDLVKCEMLTLLYVRYNEACYLVSSLLALLPH